jgi:hypothetical protein
MENCQGIKSRLAEVANLCVAIKHQGSHIAGQAGPESVSITTMAEKAGCLADECLRQLGDPGVIGSFEQWRRVGRDD